MLTSPYEPGPAVARVTSARTGRGGALRACPETGLRLCLGRDRVQVRVEKWLETVGRVSNRALCGVRTALQSDFLDRPLGRPEVRDLLRVAVGVRDPPGDDQE